MKRLLTPDERRSGPQAFWKTMRALTQRNEAFSVNEVHARARGVSRNTVQSYICACARGGFVVAKGERPVPTGQKEKLFAVNLNRIEAPFEKAHLTTGALGRPQRQLWNVIRRGQPFTTQELAIAASTDEVAVSEGTARAYVKALRGAGYLQELRPARSRFHAVLRLKPSMNTGPLPPAVGASGQVTDRNLGKVMEVTP